MFRKVCYRMLCELLQTEVVGRISMINNFSRLITSIRKESLTASDFEMDWETSPSFHFRFVPRSPAFCRVFIQRVDIRSGHRS